MLNIYSTEIQSHILASCGDVKHPRNPLSKVQPPLSQSRVCDRCGYVPVRGPVRQECLVEYSQFASSLPMLTISCLIRR